MKVAIPEPKSYSLSAFSKIVGFGQWVRARKRRNYISSQNISEVKLVMRSLCVCVRHD